MFMGAAAIRAVLSARPIRDDDVYFHSYLFYFYKKRSRTMEEGIVEDSSPGTSCPNIIQEKLAAPTGDLTEAELLRLRHS